LIDVGSTAEQAPAQQQPQNPNQLAVNATTTGVGAFSGGASRVVDVPSSRLGIGLGALAGCVLLGALVL